MVKSGWIGDWDDMLSACEQASGQTSIETRWWLVCGDDDMIKSSQGPAREVGGRDGEMSEQWCRGEVYAMSMLCRAVEGIPS